MRQQPATRTTTIRPRTTTNESRRLVGEFLWVSPPTVGPIDLPPPPTSRCDSLVGFSGPNEFPHHHESPGKPTAASDGQRRPTQVHSSPRKANAGPRRPTAPNDGQRRPTAPNDGQQRPTAAHGRPTQDHEGPQHPTTANDGQRRPFDITSRVRDDENGLK